MNPLKWFRYKCKRAIYWYIIYPKIEKQRALMRNDKDALYEAWIKKVEECYEKINIEGLEYQPKISVIVPVYNVLDEHLIPCLESVLNQEYPNWELCIADDCSTWANVRETLQRYEEHPQVKIAYREQNGHISACTNTALSLATGDYVALLDCDDVLSRNALSEVVKLLNQNPELDFIYSDEDKIDTNGEHRHMPYFKPDWSPDTFMSFMYTCHLSVFRRSIVEKLGGMRRGVEGAQDYDFTLRFTEVTDRIGHISKILYHWRERKESTASHAEAKSYVLEAAKKAKEDALKRRGLQAKLEFGEEEYQYHVNYIWNQYPKVSIIIPSKDNYDVLYRCIDTLSRITDYPDYEVVLVDNGSTQETRTRYSALMDAHGWQYIYEERAFNFSYMCNLGAKHAAGEYYLFLNDDIEILHADWLRRMVGQAMLSHTGAVGAKLLYPDRKTIQHTGVMVIPDGPVHALGGMDDTVVHDFFRNTSNYNYIAVTGACLMIRRERFEEAEGFYEGLAVAYNDIDLCFKLAEKGYYNVVRNDVVLIHHESVSRGYDTQSEEKMQRLIRERTLLFRRHPQYEKRDPFYNENLAKHRVDFDFAYDDESIKITCYEIEEMTNINAFTKYIMNAIDEIEESKYNCHIRGWIVLKEREDVCLPCVILRTVEGTMNLYLCHTKELLYRNKEVSIKINKKYRIYGFECYVDKSQIKTGTYEIGLLLGQYLVMTEKKIKVDKEEKYLRKLPVYFK